jgi:PAS domain S-box-containing protein
LLFPLIREKGSSVLKKKLHDEQKSRVITEHSLLESEEKYRLILENSLDAILLTTPDGPILSANQAACKMFQRTEEEICRLGRTALIDITDPDLQKLFEERKRTGKAQGELMMIKKDGTKFPVELSSAIFTDRHGQIRTSMIIRDITGRKHAEDLLRQTMNRIIEAEETVRREAAHQLHDQVGQNLTALNLNLSFILNQIAPFKTEKLETRLIDSMGLVEDTVTRIRNIMAELRPSVLDDFGLFAALRWSLALFTERTSIATEVIGTDLPDRLPENIEYALFRMTQEVLHNVMKHSKALHVSVDLKEFAGVVGLTIFDDGIGFDLNSVSEKKIIPGYGLINISEQMKALGGTFRVLSEPGSGTTIILEIKRTKP